MGSIVVGVLAAPEPAFGPTNSDNRCVLYVNDRVYNSLSHQLTKPTLVLLRSTDGEPRAAAQVRHIQELPPAHRSGLDVNFNAVEGQATAFASHGLATALTASSIAISMSLEQIDNNTIPSALEVRLSIDIEENAYAHKILRCMQRLAPQLLLGTLVWHGRRLALTWCNRVTVAIVLQTGGANFVSCIGPATAVHVSTASPSALHDLRPVPASAAANVGRDLASHADVAQQTIAAIAQRFAGSGPSSPRGILLHGVPGVGKSHFLRLLAKHMPSVAFHSVSSPDIFQTNAGLSEQKLFRAFDEAAQSPWSILVFEDIDALAGASDTALDKSVFGTFLTAIGNLPHHVVVIGTTNRKEVLDPALTTNGRLDVCVAMLPPTLLERQAVLAKLCASLDVADSVLAQMAQRTSGFVSADLVSLVREAAMASLADGSPSCVTLANVEAALAVVRPSVLQSQRQAARTDAVHMFGVDDALKTLNVAVLGPLRDSSAYRRMGISPPRGVLLTGPAGSGKSHALTYVAQEVGAFATVVPVLCTDLVTKVVGGTEAALADLFATARLAAPCVLLLDQIESLAPVRGFDTSSEQTFDRVLSMLLLEMDGVGSSSSAAAMRKLSHEEFLRQHVVLIATTTHASQLDPAILRPGRFDLEIGLAFPTGKAREQVVAHLLQQTPVALEDEFRTADDFTRWIVDATDGVSVGQLNAIFQEAALACLRHDITATAVSMATFRQALVQEVAKARQPVADNEQIDSE
ncbi:cell division cycle protein 48 [Achlya hypogyna]|uniref:Cell division cycle protein 48 n=1 Tax=Achlya hypogyna TaxID=1202772 RepID=A0A1V9YV76_ACHHY|nr:cell division cycle protein 48 [Achlya hypogyna]